MYDSLCDKTENKVVIEKFIRYLLQSNIRIILTNKKIEERQIKKLFENFILIIDLVRIEEINLFKSIFEKNYFIYNISNQDLFCEFDHQNNKNNIKSHENFDIFESKHDKIDSSQFYDTHDSLLHLEIIFKNTKNIILAFKDISKPNLVKTIIIRKLSPKLDEDRRNCLKCIIREYTDLIINMLDENYKVNFKIFYSDYYKIIKKLINDNNFELFIDSKNSENCIPVLNTILEQIDKNIFYKFQTIKHELNDHEINEIRNKIFFTEDILKEILEMIHFIISN